MDLERSMESSILTGPSVCVEQRETWRFFIVEMLRLVWRLDWGVDS